MKYKLICVSMLLGLIVTVSAATYLEQADNGQISYRYHQHLEEPGYTPCVDHGDEMFCSHLPLVVIDTEGQEIPGALLGEEDYFGQSLYTTAEDGSDLINVSVSVIDNISGNNHLTDKADFTTRSLFRIRGNSSRRFEKSPYLMKFVDEDGLDRDIEVMGMDAHNEWALHGPYLDKSLVRNYLWYNTSGEIMEYAPNVRYCEVFVNGDYRGLYLMVETITNGKMGRLQMSQSFKGQETTGYLLRLDRPTEADLESLRDIFVFSERVGLEGADVAVRYPGRNKLTQELIREIELDYSAFEKALYSYDHDTADYGYWNYIDVDNFIDYYLINAYSCNQDVMQYSTYIYKEPGGKFKMCVWDFNNSCDNFIDDSFSSDLFSARGILFTRAPIYGMLFRDNNRHFANQVIDRYRELRKSYFSDEYMAGYIDDTLEWLGPAVERNYVRWIDAFNADQLNQMESEINRNRHTTQEAAQYLKEWLADYGAFLDEHIDVLKFYGHPSTYKKWEH